MGMEEGRSKKRVRKEKIQFHGMQFGFGTLECPLCEFVFEGRNVLYVVVVVAVGSWNFLVLHKLHDNAQCILKPSHNPTHKTETI